MATVKTVHLLSDTGSKVELRLYGAGHMVVVVNPDDDAFERACYALTCGEKEWYVEDFSIDPLVESDMVPFAEDGIDFWGAVLSPLAKSEWAFEHSGPPGWAEWYLDN